MRTNGTLTLLVINKSASSNLTANFNLSGYVPYGNAAIYSYGIPQDEAARTGVGSPDIVQTNFIGAAASFSATFAPFSATVMVMSPANQPPVTPTSLVATASNAVVSLSWNGSAGADSYIVKRSTTSGSGYTNIATGVTATSYLDSGVVGGTTYYYVVAATNNLRRQLGLSRSQRDTAGACAATVADAGHRRGGSCRQFALRRRSVHCVWGRSGHSRHCRCVPVRLYDCDRGLHHHCPGGLRAEH